jgi:hypothetical protein
MRFTLLAIIILCSLTSVAQTNKTWTALLSFQGNATTYDRTFSNNSGGIGFGLQTHLGKNTRAKGIIEVNGDLFAGTKELLITANGKQIDAKSAILSFYGGGLWQLTSNFFITGAVGTSIYNGKGHLGLRPSVGLFTSRRKTWLIRTSFTNVFQRDEISNENFGYLSFSIALKLR